MACIIKGIEYSCIGSHDGGTYFIGETEESFNYDRIFELKDEDMNDYKLIKHNDNDWALHSVDINYPPTSPYHWGLYEKSGSNYQQEVKWEGELNEVTWL